jgi:hypothetical protein
LKLRVWSKSLARRYRCTMVYTPFLSPAPGPAALCGRLPTEYTLRVSPFGGTNYLMGAMHRNVNRLLVG